MSVPPIIPELVERFTAHREAYTRGGYNETQLRREFIDPFFVALGWDVYNEQGYAEAYKDVVHEDAIKVGGTTKAPDYSFRIGGRRKFFVEAKKPSVDIRHDVHPAYQVRRYAWNAKLPLSIVSDFQEFAVYDCRTRPKPTDKASTARLMYFTYTEYTTRWDEIAGTFSKDAILKGAFDKYAQKKRRKRGTAEVDDEFLADMERWRIDLAKHVIRHNTLTVRQLNHAVQLILDRIIFLRICEDRGIEPAGALQSLLNGERVYERLFEKFRHADQRYNSGLFHFDIERGRGEPDRLTPGLTVGNRPLKDIITHLYPPESPYEFSVMPADILGQVYERFLGNVISLSATGKTAKVEAKPEVRKAGGVYYTPTYIVEYIVEHTVGALLKGEEDSSTGVSPVNHSSGTGDSPWRGEGASEPSPSGRGQGEGSSSSGGFSGGRELIYTKTRPPRMNKPLRVLDPACGSGSFLLGAYEYLLKWHLKWYVEHDPEKWARTKHPPIVQRTSALGGTDSDQPESSVRRAHSTDDSADAPPGASAPLSVPPADYKLTTPEKKRILLDHIFGVDIDAQAVEVTKLSLLLKVLEGENEETIRQQFRLFHERALPDLSNNIKCGNSLIGPDFYEGQQMSMFDDEDIYRINAFDWEKEFPEVFPSPTSGGGRGVRGEGSSPGFDAVIGNPPWLMAGYYVKPSLEFLREHYQTATGKFDLYYLFVERGYRLMRSDGLFGVIIPNKFFHTRAAKALRTLLANGRSIRSIIDFGDSKIFANATNYSCIVVLSKSKNDQFTFSQAKEGIVVSSAFQIDAQLLSRELWTFQPRELEDLFERMRDSGTALEEIVDRFGTGVQSGADRILILGAADRKGIEQALLQPVRRGRDVRRYRTEPHPDLLILPYVVANDAFAILDEDELGEFVNAWAYLNSHRERLAKRVWFGKSAIGLSGHWYGMMYIDAYRAFSRPHILTPSLSDRSNFSIGDGHLFVTGTAGVTSIVPSPTIEEDILFILGVLNAKLLSLYVVSHSPIFSGGYFKFSAPYLRKLPIRTIDFSNADDVAKHDRMVELVQSMLDMNAKLQGSTLAPDPSPRGRGETDLAPQEVKVLTRRIEQTDREIDQLVYELYRLTDDEIRIVEEATG